MSFTWLNKQGVRSDRGFEFQFTGRFTAEYRESGQIFGLAIESGNGQVWITEDKRKRLAGSISDKALLEATFARRIANIREALAFQGLTLVD